MRSQARRLNLFNDHHNLDHDDQLDQRWSGLDQLKKKSKVKKAAFCLPKWLGVRGSRGGLVQLGGGIDTPLQITLPDPWPARRMCDFLDRLIPFWLDLGWPARGLYHKKPCGGPLWNRKAFANKEKKGLALMLFAATACSNNHFSSFSLQCR